MNATDDRPLEPHERAFRPSLGAMLVFVLTMLAVYLLQGQVMQGYEHPVPLELSTPAP